METPVYITKQSRQWRRLIAIVLGLALTLAVLAWWFPLRGPIEATEIYRGVVYSCQAMPESDESGGLVHLVRVDLTAPGVELYFTPSEAPGVPLYHLEWTSTVARRENLAVAVNGALFIERSRWSMPGEQCRGLETLVSNHQVSHVDPNSYLLWFDDNRTPHIEYTKPPSAAALSAAKWGIGGQGVALQGGRVSEYSGHNPDRRTLLGIAPPLKVLWIAAYEHASFYAAAKYLAAQGATDSISVDGGTSTTMVLGKDAQGVRPGTLLGGWRPVATHVGVRALPKR
jgi:hypothetical protein